MAAITAAIMAAIMAAMAAMAAMGPRGQGATGPIPAWEVAPLHGQRRGAGLASTAGAQAGRGPGRS